MFRSNKGFTLIEILVALLIVSIIVGVALFAFGDFGNKRRLRMAAEQFVNYVTLIQEQATVEASTLGIQINHNQYQALRFNFDKQYWQSIPGSFLSRPQSFPKGTRLRINPNPAKNAPAIIVNPSGDTTPFHLKLGLNNQPDILEIIGENNGHITIHILHTS